MPHLIADKWKSFYSTRWCNLSFCQTWPYKYSP